MDNWVLAQTRLDVERHAQQSVEHCADCRRKMEEVFLHFHKAGMKLPSLEDMAKITTEILTMDHSGLNDDEKVFCISAGNVFAFLCQLAYVKEKL